MAPRRKGRPPSRTAVSPPGNNTEDVAMTINPRSRMAKLPVGLQDDPWTDEQEAALFKGIVRWKPENVIDHAGSPDSEGYEEAYYQFALPKEDFSESMFQRRLADRASPSSSASESAPPPTAGGTSIAVTRRGSTVDDTEVLVLDPRSSPASIRGARAIRTFRGARSTRRSQLNEVSSLQKRRDVSKAYMEGSSVTQDDDRGESTEEADEEDHNAHEQASKSSNTKVTRRRSTRRRVSRHDPPDVTTREIE
ncbi:MAG: hypothetical protein LQ348_006309 [Seirophora lacunosa]|nr:MAG: hypothetical protein LQ348_006309 [Seirophora lacunosa]